AVVPDAQVDRLRLLAGDVDLGVVDHARGAVLVADVVAVDHELPAAHWGTGEIRADIPDAAAGDIEAAQLTQRRRRVLHEGERVVAYREPGAGRVELGHEVTEQYLPGQRAFQHAREVHGDLADDVAERGRIEAVDLLELVVLADVKRRAQLGHPGVLR